MDTIPEKNITALENVQRRATKLIPSLKDLSYPERLQALNLPTLAYRCCRGDMIELYKILMPTYDPAVTTGFIQLSGDHITRGHSLKLKKIRLRLKLRQCSFPLGCTEHWNNLPTSVVEAISVASSDLVEFGVAKGSRSCHVELLHFSDHMTPSPCVRGGSLDLAMLDDRRVHSY